jgi:RecB family exonuclease
MDLEADPRFWPSRRVETLTRIIYRIFEEHVQADDFKGFRFLDEGLKCLLVRRALETRAMEPDGLVYLSRLLLNGRHETGYPGIYRSIIRFFSFLTRNNYQDLLAEELGRRILRLDEEGVSTAENRHALESDLAWLLGDYEETKRQVGGYDEDDVLAGVRSYLLQGGTPRVLAQSDVLVLDGFIFFSRVEEDILFQLADRMVEVWWLVDHEYTAADPLSSLTMAAGREPKRHRKHELPEDFDPVGRNEADRILMPLVSLMERFHGAGLNTEVAQATARPFLNPLAGGFYLHGHPTEVSGESLKIKSFATPVDEVRAIAGEIKRLDKEAGPGASHDLGRIRVIFPRLEAYSSIVREVFAEYRIPFSLTKGLPLNSHPIAQIFLRILETPLNGFRCEDLFQVFSEGLVQEYLNREMTVAVDEGCDRFLREEYIISDKHGWEDAERELRDLAGRRFDIFSFDKVARQIGLIALGADRSALHDRQFRRVRDFYRDRYRQAIHGEERKQLVSEYYRFLIQIQIMLEGLEPFSALLNQRTPRMIVSCLERILEALGFPENIVNIHKDITHLEPTAIRAMLRRDLKAFGDLRALAAASAEELEVEQHLFQATAGHALLDRYVTIFRTRLNDRYLLDERNPNVVRISEWLEIRGRSFDTVFAAGLTADAFPPREETDFILSETPNRIFRRPDMMDQSKHLFSHLLRNYRKALYLSYPRYREERELAPSAILVDLATWLTPARSPEGDTGILEEAFPWGTNPYLSSEHEWLDATRQNAQVSHDDVETLFPLSAIILKPGLDEEAILTGVHLMRSRCRSDGLSGFDGLVQDASRFGEWGARDPEVYSPSQLEILANCPLRYLFAQIYRVEPLEERGLEISPREMGTHVHAVLKLFFKRLKDEGKNVADVGLERAFALALEIAEGYFGKRPSLAHLEFFALQKREFLAGLDNPGDARDARDHAREGLFAQMLRFEADAFQGRLPGGFEYRFGTEATAPVVFGGARIRGSIDRFDLSRQEGETAYLYDYKTGGSPSSEMIKRGLSFQLPFYMLALKTRLGFRRVSACCYSLKRRDFIEEAPLKQKINDHSEPKWGLDLNGVRLLDDFVEHLRRLLAEGTFHHSADEEICPFCEYRYACHHDGRRMAHLLQVKGGNAIYSGERNRERWRQVDEFRRDWKKIGKEMELAFSLKTAAARAKHARMVMDYGRSLADHSHAVPLKGAFIKERLEEIEAFEKEYRSREPAA